MKKIIYSKYTKFIFVLLFIVSITMAIFLGSNGFVKLADEKVQVYNFERRFEEARFFNPMLQEVEQRIFDVYCQLKNSKVNDVVKVEEFDKNINVIDYAKTEVDMEINNNVKNIVVDKELVNENIEKALKDLYYLDQINYCIDLNGKILSNCGETNPIELTNNDFYMFMSKDEFGNVERMSNSSKYYYSPLLEESFYDLVEPITISVSVKNSVVEECNLLWEKQAEIVYQTIGNTFVFLVLAFISFIYLAIVCGKDKNGDTKSLFIDRVWVEIQILLTASIIFCCAGAWFVLFDEYFSGYFVSDFINKCVAVISVIVSGTLLFFTLSMIRNIKNKNFLNRCITFRIVSYLWKKFIRIMKWFYNKTKDIVKIFVRSLYLKTGLVLISSLLIYTALIGICGILVPESGFFLIIAILFFCFAAFFIAKRSNEMDEIKKGIKEIREGNLSYKIPEMKSQEMKIFATDVNELIEEVIETTNFRTSLGEKSVPISAEVCLNEDEWLDRKIKKLSGEIKYSLSEESESRYKKVLNRLKNNMVLASTLAAGSSDGAGFSMEEALNPKDSLENIIKDLKD